MESVTLNRQPLLQARPRPPTILKTTGKGRSTSARTPATADATSRPVADTTEESDESDDGTNDDRHSMHTDRLQSDSKDEHEHAGSTPMVTTRATSTTKDLLSATKTTIAEKMAPRNVLDVLKGDDGRLLGDGSQEPMLGPTTIRCSFPGLSLRIPYRQSRLLRMAFFSLAAVWAVWSLLFLSSVRRQVFAIPTSDNTNHQFYTTRPCTAATFSSVLPKFASVERVSTVTANGNYGEGAIDLGFPTNATKLPPLCAVTIAVHNGTSNYRFAIFLPTAANWNGRIMTIGSASFAGGINWPNMGEAPHYGFATLATDGGHNSTQSDLDWAPTTTDKLLDWGWRALHGSVGLGKTLTSQYYSGAQIAYSYYSGCSTGGRQGLKEIQVDASSFDGTLVGAPAWDTSQLMPWLTRIGAANMPDDGANHIDLPEFATLAAAALAQCDHLDGHNDTIISKPELCVLDYAPITCGNPAVPPGGSCLTPEQVATAKYLYADAFTAKGDFIHSGYTLGSEDLWYVYLAFGDESDFDTRYERFWLYNDTNWNWTQYSDQVFYDSLKANLGEASANHYDISAYRDRGGKVLLYQGLADGVIMPRMTTYYYNQTIQTMGLSLATTFDSKTGKSGQHTGAGKPIQDFFRYFQVPGMQHCFASPTEVAAPWMFAAPGQATLLSQGYNFGLGWGVPNLAASATHDALLALMAWVENTSAPTSIVASVWNGDGTVNRTRPICVYPQEATYKGSGNLNLADNWKCQ